MNESRTNLLVGIPLTLLLVASLGFNAVQFLGDQKQKEKLETQNDDLIAALAKTRKLERQLQDDQATAGKKLTGRDSQILDLQGQVDSLKTAATRDRQNAKHANEAAANAQAAAAEAQARFQQAEQLAARIPDLQAELLAYQKLGNHKEIQDQLNQLAQHKVAQIVPKAPPPPPNRLKQIGVILNHDPKFDFYVINAGASIGVKKGDKYSVFRDNKMVGRIQIDRAQPNLAIATPDRAFPNPPVPFKVGDVVMNATRP